MDKKTEYMLTEILALLDLLATDAKSDTKKVLRENINRLLKEIK